MLLTMHDARTQLAQDVEREVRKHFPAAGLRHRDPAQRPARRGAELRPPGDPPRSALRGRGGVLRARQGGGRPWLSRAGGMGRGLGGDPAGAGAGATGPGRRRELRELPVELIAPNPNQPRRHFDEETLRALADSLDRARRAAAGAGAPGAGRHLRADRRRAPLARRAARRARHASPRSCARTTTPQSLELALIENMAREDLNPVEEARACALLVEELGLTREDASAAASAARASPSRTSCACSTCPTRRSTLLERGPADRGPRPRAPDGARPRRPPPARPRRRGGALVASARLRHAPALPPSGRRDHPRAAPHQRSIRTRTRGGRAPGRGPRPRTRHRREGEAEGRRLQRLARLRLARRGARGRCPSGRRRARLTSLSSARPAGD